MPRGFLGDAQVSMQFHTRDTLKAGRKKVNGNRPDLISQIRTLHRGAGFRAEAFTAVSAPVRHSGVLSTGLNVD